MAKLRSISCGLVVACVLGTVGCQFPLGGPGQPQGRPYMGPTTGYAPVQQQSYAGPVAIAPGTMTTFVPTTVINSPTLAAAPSSSQTVFNTGPHGNSVAWVASQYGVSEAELRKINNLPPGDKLPPGQFVRLPDGATAIR